METMETDFLPENNGNIHRRRDDADADGDAADESDARRLSAETVARPQRQPLRPRLRRRPRQSGRSAADAADANADADAGPARRREIHHVRASSFVSSFPKERSTR